MPVVTPTISNVPAALEVIEPPSVPALTAFTCKPEIRIEFILLKYMPNKLNSIVKLVALEYDMVAVEIPIPETLTPGKTAVLNSKLPDVLSINVDGLPEFVKSLILPSVIVISVKVTKPASTQIVSAPVPFVIVVCANKELTPKRSTIPNRKALTYVLIGILLKKELRLIYSNALKR